ncbi:MAG: hypothetical protein J3K34DRAFT_455469 [Monoraphidium minutum]|nr:MAG: hypothetical protein J3K34DRAFT_455469 [Monoraphidium minutum]
MADAAWGEVLDNDETDEDLEDEDDLMDAEGEQHPFPSDEYIVLADSLTQLHVANFAPARLSDAVSAAYRILRDRKTKLRQSDLEAVRKLLRDGITFGFDKVLRDHHLFATNTDAEEDDLFSALDALVDLAAMLFEHRGAPFAPQQPGRGAPPPPPPAALQLVELDHELTHLATLIAALFNRDAPLHEFHSTSDTPLMVDAPEWANRWAMAIPAPARAAGGWARERGGSDGEDDEAEDVEEREHEWLVALVNKFGNSNGLVAVYQLLDHFQECNLGLQMVAALTTILQRVAELMPEATLEPFRRVVVEVMGKLVPLAAADDDFLSDQGQDRTYSTLRTLLAAAHDVISCGGPPRDLEADAALAPAQQAFVLRMMEATSFVKQLSGVRELRDALRRVANLEEGEGREARVQAFVDWMEEHRLVERMLRANLHQRQYMQQVNAILHDLTLVGALTNAHLGQLWGVTEQEGTYEGVKAHVYEGLAELVAVFSPEQVDFLFSKMAARRERSELDTTKLLELLLRLARSDGQCALPERIAGLMWDIVTAPGSPRAIVEAGAKQLADVAAEYRAHSGRPTQLAALLKRCVEELRARRNHVAALRALVAAVDGLATHMIKSKENAVDRYNTVYNLFDLLVDNAAALAHATRAFLSTRPPPPPPAAAAPPGEGPWSHADLVGQYLWALQRLYEGSASFMLPQHAGSLWTELVQGAASRGDLVRAVAFFRAAVAPKDAWLEAPAAGALLRRVPALPPAHVTKEVFQLTWTVFQNVNKERLQFEHWNNGTSRGTSVFAQTLDIPDLPHLWALFESCTIPAVAASFRAKLLELYHCESEWDQHEDMATYRAALIREVAQRLESAVADLDRQGAGQQQQQQQQPDGETSLALLTRRVMRLMGIAQQCFIDCKDSAMPPVPAHRLSWQGSPVMVDVHGQQQPRMRLASHTNEYVGSLRAKVARALLGGAPVKRVRMFQGGKEFDDDSSTVGELDVRGARQVVNVQLSQKDNSFTRLAGEHRAYWEEHSPEALLSRQLAQLALHLLQAMPTSPDLAAEVQAGLREQQQAAKPPPQQQQQQEQQQEELEGPLAQALAGPPGSSNKGGSGGGGGGVARPYQLLYRMQALAATLFPSVQEGPREPAAPRAGAAPPPAEEAGAGAGADGAGARRALQEHFLASGGLRVVCGLVGRLVAARAGDAALLRELGQLVVVLIHNLMDAGTPRPAAAAAATPEPGAAPPAGGGGAAAEAEVGDSAMEDAGAEAPAAAGAAAAAAVAAAAAAAGAGLGGAGSGTAKAADRASRPGSVEADGAEDMAAEGPEVAGPSPAKAPQAGGGGGGDDKQHPPDQRQQPAQPSAQLPPRPRAPGAPAAPLQQGRPGAPAPLSLDAVTLRLMTSTLLQLAVQGARLWAAPGAPAAPAPAAAAGDGDAGPDAALVREALALLQRALDQRPELLGPLLAPGGGGGALVTDLLLSRRCGAVRAVAEDCLARLCCAAPEPLTWLLERLAAARPAAAAAPGASGEFYRLFARAARALAAAEGAPQAAYARAEALLAEEVAALRALAPAGGDDDNVALEGRFHLLHALVTALDRRCVGAGREAGLIRLLLRDYLFPQAALAHDERAGRLDLAQCAARLRPRAAAAGARRAALELAAELMREGLGPLEEGVRCLEALADAAAPPAFCVAPPKTVRRPGAYCGLRNAGATCYMNAVFQQLYMQPRIRALILGAPEVPEAQRADSVFAQLQAVFAAMALGLMPFTTPDGFWGAFKDYDGRPIDTREHQDAYEFFTRLQARGAGRGGAADCVDSHLQSARCTPALQSVMGGRFAQQVICRGLPYRSEREEEFLQISVDVRGMGSLEKSLENYVQGELMEGDNAYLCEELGRRVPAVKRACIKALPHTLVIHLKRFEFDYHSQTRFKVRDRFEFPEELDLFPYTADGLAAADADAAAGDAARPAGGAPPAPLARQSSAGDGAGAGGGGGARPEYLYDLAGVVVHSGSAFTGHYYSYAREREALAAAAARAAAGGAGGGGRRGGGWFCFDDKSVRPWDVSNLEQDCYGGRNSQDWANRGWRAPRNEVDRPHSAYMLFYERRCEHQLNVEALRGQGRSAQRPAPAAGEAAAAGGSPEPAAAAQQGGEPPAQPQGAANGAAVANGNGGGFVAPWGMPLSLYREVMLLNIDVMMRLHAFDREFFKFVRSLVENRGEVGGQLSQRKARRRELPPPAPLPSPGAGAASGGSCSAMSCDPSASGAGGGGGDGAVAGAEQLPSPGPSSRRGEEAEAIATTLTRLALRFQLQLYQRAVAALRSDAAVWGEALKSLLNAGPAAGACQLAALQLLEANPGWLVAMLVECHDAAARGFVADLLSFLLVHAAGRCNLHHALPAAVAAAAGGEPLSSAVAAAAAAAAPLAGGVLGVAEQLVDVVVAGVAACAAPGGEDQCGVAAAAAVLADYASRAPPAHAALLLTLRPDLPLCLVEHLAGLRAAYPDAADDAKTEGPAAAGLLLALASRACNLERLTLDLLAASPPQQNALPDALLAGAANPYAAAGRGGGGGGGGGDGGGVEGVLLPRVFKRLHDADVLNALCDLPVVASREAIALLQLLTWENAPAAGHVAGQLAAAAACMGGALVFTALPHLVGPMRDVLGVRDSASLMRAWVVLCGPGGGGGGVLGSVIEGASQGWNAVRKLLLLSAAETALRALPLAQAASVLVGAASGHASRGGGAALHQELVTVELEAAAFEASDPQGCGYLARNHLGAIAYYKQLLMHWATQQTQQQQASVAAALAVQQQRAAAAAAAGGGGGEGAGAGQEGEEEEGEAPEEGPAADGGSSFPEDAGPRAARRPARAAAAAWAAAVVLAALVAPAAAARPPKEVYAQVTFPENVPIEQLPGANLLNPRTIVNAISITLAPTRITGPSNGRQLFRFTGMAYADDVTGRANIFGPTMRVRRGDVYVIKLTNALVQAVQETGEVDWIHNPANTNMHTHGIHAETGVPSQDTASTYVLGDNVFFTLPARASTSELPQSRLFNLKIPRNHLPGLHWYHPHQHGSTTLQVGTAHGAIVVEDDHNFWMPPGTGCEAFRAVTEVAADVILDIQLFFFKTPTKKNVKKELRFSKTIDDINNGAYQYYSEISLPVNPYGTKSNKAKGRATTFKGRGLNVLLVNGGYMPIVKMQAGVWQRQRILYSGIKGFMVIAFFDAATNLPTKACEMQLYAKDGVYLMNLPRKIDGIFLAASNRAEVLVRCTGPPGATFVASTRSCEPFSINCFGYLGDDVPADRLNHIGPMFQDVLWTVELLPPPPLPPGSPLVAPLPQRACAPLRPSYATDLRDAALTAAGYDPANVTAYQLGFGPIYLPETPSPREAYSYACGYTNGSGEGERFAMPDSSPIPLELGKVVQWEFQDLDFHPMHVHINPYQIQELNSTWLFAGSFYTPFFEVGDYHDTLNLPMMDLVKSQNIHVPLRFQPGQYSGYTVSHCHFLMHEDVGCMKVVWYKCPTLDADKQSGPCPNFTWPVPGTLPFEAYDLNHLAPHLQSCSFEGCGHLWLVGLATHARYLSGTFLSSSFLSSQIVPNGMLFTRSKDAWEDGTLTIAFMRYVGCA